MVPANVPGPDGIVGQPVEGHLLHVEVAVKEKAPAVHHQEGQKDGKGEPQAQQEGF